MNPAILPALATVGAAALTFLGGFALQRRSTSHKVEHLDAKVVVEESRSLREFYAAENVRLETQRAMDRAEIERLYAEIRARDAEIRRLEQGRR